MKICKNENGVMELPVQYVVATIVAGISIFLLGSATYSLWKEHEMKKAVGEIEKIIDEAEEMAITAQEGTKITIDVNLPNSVEKVIFGSSKEELRNRYCIIMKWGNNKSFFASNAKFLPAVLYGGRHTVTLELIRIGEENYVKIYTG